MILFQQLRLKHCAIHCYIAHNIFIHQQISRVSPLWSMAAAKASKNPNVIPPNGKASNSVIDSSQRKPPNQVASTNNMPVWIVNGFFSFWEENSKTNLFFSFLASSCILLPYKSTQGFWKLLWVT